MAAFWEEADHSVGHMFSLCFGYLWFWLFPVLNLGAGFGCYLSGLCIRFTCTIDDARCYLLGPQQGATQAAVTTNEKLRRLKSSCSFSVACF